MNKKTEASHIVEEVEKPRKSLTLTWLFAYVFGHYGADRFYLGQIWTGILKLITFGGLGIWSFIDVVRTGLGDRRDKKKRPLEGTPTERKVLKILSIIYIVIWVLTVIGFAIWIPLSLRDVGNVTRQRDVDAIKRVLINYETDISSELATATTPGEVPSDSSLLSSVKICGGSCTSADGFVTAGLMHYSGDHVLYREYQAGLQAPDLDTVYLINNATCNNNELGSQKTGEVAILYKQQNLLSGTRSACMVVPHQKFKDIFAPPYCGLSVVGSMPDATVLYVESTIEYNKGRQLIDEQLGDNTEKVTATLIDQQLALDKQYIMMLDRINFDDKTQANVNILVLSIKQYNALLLEMRQYLPDSQENMPTWIHKAIAENAAALSGAVLAVRDNLNLPKPSCSFRTPS